MLRLRPCVGGISLPRPTSTPAGVWCRAAKGFGKVDKADRTDEDATQSKPRGKRVKLRQNQRPVIPNQDNPQLQNTTFKSVENLEDQLKQQVEEEEFAKRLAALKQQGQEKALAAGKLPAASYSTQPAGAVFDAAKESIYDNPPSVAETLLGQLNSDVTDPKLRAAQFGPNQLGIAAGAIIFGLIYVLVTGGDFATSKRYKGIQSAQRPPDAVEEGIIKGRIAQLEEGLRANPQDVVALQQLGFSYAQLLQYDRAANYLDRLVALRPNDADAWRLLGETTLLSEQSARAVAAYEKAIALRDNDQQIVTGLVDAYIANGQQAKAVEFLKGLRERIASSQPAAATAAAAAPSTASPEAIIPTPAQPADAPEPAAPAPPEGSNEDTASTMVSAMDKSIASNNDQATDASSTPAADVAGPASNSEGSSTAAAPSASAAAPAASPAVGAAGAKQDKQIGQQANQPLIPLDPVAVELLLGKTYNAWRGHNSEALAVYDALIKSAPEDFRGYLARGMYLKENGRRAEAERMFVQARFYAPASRQALVNRMSNTNPVDVVVGLPDNS